jgi:hypothetical protein
MKVLMVRGYRSFAARYRVRLRDRNRKGRWSSLDVRLDRAFFSIGMLQPLTFATAHDAVPIPSSGGSAD